MCRPTFAASSATACSTLRCVLTIAAVGAVLTGCIYNTSNYYANDHSTVTTSPTTVDKPVTATTDLRLEGQALGEALGTAVKTAIVP